MSVTILLTLKSWFQKYFHLYSKDRRVKIELNNSANYIILIHSILIITEWIHFAVSRAGIIEIDDGGSVSYHASINATCTENMLRNTFSGWKLDTPKPIEELQVNNKSYSIFIWNIRVNRFLVSKTPTVNMRWEWIPSLQLRILSSFPFT